LLRLLYEDFLFEKRGSSPDVTRAPIFSVRDGRLRFRYLGRYIRAGHEVTNTPLSVEAQRALTKVDELLEREALVHTFSLRRNEMLFFDNLRTVHGRTGFEDDPRAPRVMERVWLRRLPAMAPARG
jgi:hypothetical protein